MPVILVTADRRDPEGLAPGPRVRPLRPEAYLGESYINAVRQAGGQVLLLPPGETDPEHLLDRVDGVLITGGAFDIHPRWYGQTITARIDRIEDGRTAAELAVARACLAKDIPVLGICGGMQVLAVAAGGSLHQHVDGHEQPTDPANPSHEVRFAPATRYMPDRIPVNSTHHQAVDSPGELLACGWAEDGVIEAISSPSHAFVFGVQWHPELLGDLRLYQALISVSPPRA